MHTHTHTHVAQLTPVALMEGMALAKTVALNEPTKPDYEAVASAVFSHPELAGVVGGGCLRVGLSYDCLAQITRLWRPRCSLTRSSQAWWVVGGCGWKWVVEVVEVVVGSGCWRIQGGRWWCVGRAIATPIVLSAGGCAGHVRPPPQRPVCHLLTCLGCVAWVNHSQLDSHSPMVPPTRGPALEAVACSSRAAPLVLACPQGPGPLLPCTHSLMLWTPVHPPTCPPSPTSAHKTGPQ